MFAFYSFVLSIPNWLARSWVITILWHWFLQPMFNVSLSLPVSMGIMIFAQLMTPSNLMMAVNEKMSKLSESNPLTTAFLIQFYYCVSTFVGLMLAAFVHWASQ